MPRTVIETFWVLVLVINVAVLVVSLGLMLVAFEGDLRRGGILLIAGLVLFGLASRRYSGFPDGETTDHDAALNAISPLNATLPLGATPRRTTPHCQRGNGRIYGGRDNRNCFGRRDATTAIEPERPFMKTVEDDTGKRYLLRKRSDTASLVRDPETGNECYIRNDRLEAVGDESALETAARSVSDPVLTLLTNVHDEETLRSTGRTLGAGTARRAQPARRLRLL